VTVHQLLLSPSNYFCILFFSERRSSSTEGIKAVKTRSICDPANLKCNTNNMGKHQTFLAISARRDLLMYIFTNTNLGSRLQNQPDQPLFERQVAWL
jgi:hypothetical protein